jgi:ribosomal protein S18 acetylase RimI-like enzyme
MKIEYKINSASKNQILEHLQYCNNQFVPRLDSRISILEYSSKIESNAIIFEAWYDQKLIGMIAMYVNDVNNGYITNVSVYSEFNGKGIAKKLFQNLLNYNDTRNIKNIELEVNELNTNAINLYSKIGFVYVEKKENQILMSKNKI